MKVAKLTLEQAESIRLKQFNNSQFYNPVLDADGDYVIFLEEIRDTVAPEYLWVKTLPLSDFNPHEIDAVD